MAKGRDLDERFVEDGYVVVEDFFSEAEIDALASDISAAGHRLEDESALNKGQMVFLSNLFLKSRKLEDFVCQDRLVEFLTPFIGPDFWVRWDQCVCKGPGAPEFPWHQDNAYNRLKDAHFQLWVGVTPTTRDNGGLWLAPGSHKMGILPHHCEGNHMVCDVIPEGDVLVEAGKGDVVLFSSLMLHRTKANVTTLDRWAYVIEYMKLDHYDPYIKPPYLIVAEDGTRTQQFVRSYRGSRSFRNQIKYHGVGGSAKRMIRGILGRDA